MFSLEGKLIHKQKWKRQLVFHPCYCLNFKN